jgi:hypothetical protein
MVTATIDNAPVSIQLSGSSTTVPSNETWVVNIGVHGGSNFTGFELNGVGISQSDNSETSPHPPQFKMVLTGGDTVTETFGFSDSMVSMQGFIVDS